MNVFSKKQIKPLTTGTPPGLKRGRISEGGAPLLVSDTTVDLADQLTGQDYVAALLTSADIPFSEVVHDRECSSQKAASKAHVRGNVLGKAVLVKVKYTGAKAPEVVMCVLRAHYHITFEKVAASLGGKSATMCTQEEVLAMTEKLGLPVEAGAVPPLPQLFKLRCFMDKELATDDVIYFNAGSHDKLISMAMAEYRRLATPSLLPFAHQQDIHIKAVTRMFDLCGFEVSHCVLRHKATPTAAETAKVLHVPGSAAIKAVVVKLDGTFTLCVLSSTQVVDLEKLMEIKHTKQVEVVTAVELHDNFPAVPTQNGTIPPFGHLFGMPTIVASNIVEQLASPSDSIVFSAGTTTDAIKMSYEDYMRVLRALQQPQVLDIAHSAPDDSCHSSYYKRYLQEKGVAFTTVRHARAFTASHVATMSGVSGHKLAKTVVVTSEGTTALAVLRADDQLDLPRLTSLAHSQSLSEQVAGCKSSAPLQPFEVASEKSIAGKFEHTEIGAVPPLGHLFDMKTYVDSKLATSDMLYMSAGTHKELLGITWEDFVKLARPVVGPISGVNATGAPSAPRTPTGSPIANVKPIARASMPAEA